MKNYLAGTSSEKTAVTVRPVYNIDPSSLAVAVGEKGAHWGADAVHPCRPPIGREPRGIHVHLHHSRMREL